MTESYPLLLAYHATTVLLRVQEASGPARQRRATQSQALRDDLSNGEYVDDESRLRLPSRFNRFIQTLMYTTINLFPSVAPSTA